MPPDNWDVEEQEEEDQKEKLRNKDRDLEYLFHDVVQDPSLDDYLKTDLQSKMSDPQYKEMLVSIQLWQWWALNINRIVKQWLVCIMIKGIILLYRH